MSGGVPFPVYFWSIGRTFSLRFRNIMLSDGAPVPDNWISLTSRRSCKVSALMVTHIPAFLEIILFTHEENNERIGQIVASRQNKSKHWTINITAFSVFVNAQVLCELKRLFLQLSFPIWDKCSLMFVAMLRGCKLLQQTPVQVIIFTLP